MIAPPEDIVISGLGIASAIGCDPAAFSTGLRSGESGIRRARTFRCGASATHGVGEVSGLEERCAKVFDVRRLRRFDPVAAMGLYAGICALRDAGHLDENNAWRFADPRRVGLVMGTGVGGIQSTEQFFRKAVESSPQSANPSLFPETIPNAATGHLSIELGIKGPSTTLTQRQATTEVTLGFALDLLARQDLDLVVAGAVEDVALWSLKVHEICGALAEGEDAALRPFDRRRSGTLLGEGGAIFILERAAAVARRGGKIYGRFQALGFGGVPASPTRWPEHRSVPVLAESLKTFLIRNALSPANLSWVSASALGSPVLDQLEAEVLAAALGPEVPVSALLGATGSFACASSLRLAAAVMSLQDDFVPPTVGLREADGPPLAHVLEKSRVKRNEKVLLHTLADGGSFAYTLVSRS